VYTARAPWRTSCSVKRCAITYFNKTIAVDSQGNSLKEISCVAKTIVGRIHKEGLGRRMVSRSRRWGRGVMRKSGDKRKQSKRNFHNFSKPIVTKRV